MPCLLVLRQDVKIIYLKVIFAFGYNRHALATTNRAGDKSDNLIIGFSNQKVRIKSSFNLLLTLWYKAVYTAFLKPLLLKLMDELDIRFYSRANERLFHIWIIRVASSQR